MSEFEATIKAKRLKHAIAVLRRVNDEAVIDIEDFMTSRVVNPMDSMTVQVTISRDAFEYFSDPVPQRIGVDLDKVAGIIRSASAKDIIELNQSLEHHWFFKRTIHQRSMTLFDPDQIKKCPARFDIDHTVSVQLSGKEFKDIVANTEDLEVNWIRLTANVTGATFYTETKDVTPDQYTATLQKDRVEILSEGTLTETLYSIDLFRIAAAGMIASDDVVLKFATDLLCTIEYTRDGIAVEYMIAPRIKSD